MAHVYTSLADYQASLPYGVVEETWEQCVAECDAVGYDPKRVWGYGGRLGGGFAMTHLATGETTLLVLKEAREGLSLTELDAVLRHEVAHFTNGDLSDHCVSKSFARVMKEEIAADAAARSAEHMLAAMITCLAATDTVVNDRRESVARKTAKTMLWLTPQFALRAIVLKTRAWFGR